jgi:hypothetical protein
MGADSTRDVRGRPLLTRAVGPEAAATLATPATPAASESAPTPTFYEYAGEVFASEREMLARFLDDFRAAEVAGATVVAVWAAIAQDPVVRGGLRAIADRERRHGDLLAERLREIGGECRAALDPGLAEAAHERLASRTLSDAEKLTSLVACHADIDTALRPLRAVIARIEADQETKALLSAIVDEEVMTLRWIAATGRRLAPAPRSTDRTG